jgi:RHS repeat-associated protein
MREKILLAFIVWTFCAAVARPQSGPDNDADAAPGYVNSVFHHGQVDSINLYNGQLTIPISLGPSYPVGPKLKFQAILTYNSRKWDYGHPTIQPPDFVYQPLVGNPALGQGWEFTLGAIKLCKQGSASGFCYFGPDGSQHMFNHGSKTGDASQLFLSGSGPFDMWDGEGNHYVFGWQVSGFDDNASPGYIHDFGMGRDGWYLTSVTDPFGNSYSVSYHTAIPPCWSYGSPTGPCSLTPVMTCPTSPVRTWIPQTVNLPTGSVQILLRTQGPTSNMIGDFIFPIAGGASAVWSLTYEQVWDNFHDCSSFVIYMPVLVQRITAVQLPSDLGGSPSYRFSNSCPFTMTLPTGASIAYTFGPYTFFHGRAGAVVPNCQGMTPQNVQYVETSFPDVCGPSQPGPSPPQPDSAVSATCSLDNEARWVDTVSGVLRRTETIPGIGTATTDYTQYSFPYGEGGSISAKQDAQTLTVVLSPYDADNRRRARAVFFSSSPRSAGSPMALFTEPGDRVGADLEERVFDGDPNTAAAISTSTPACSGTESDQPFCSSRAVRLTQRSYEYDDATREIGNRRLKVETTCYGPTASNGSCQSGLSHTVAFSNQPGVDWDTNGRHYNIEQHSGSLGNDDRTVTTTWTPSVSPWLPNLFNRRTETQGLSTVDHYFEFTPSNGFFRGDFLYDAGRQIVFLTCRYDDGAGNVGQDFSATYSGQTSVPPSNACSLFYPTYPTGAVGINGDAFGKVYTHRNGLLLSARWMANPTTPASWFLKNFFRDPATGWITFSVDSAGLGTGYSYDSLGRVTGIFPPADAPTTVNYDSTTQTTATRDAGAGLFTLERYIYDGLGRISREIRLMPGNSALPYAVRLTQYDGASHTSFVSEWAGCSELPGCAVSSPSAGTRSSNFDPLGRPQTMRNADGATTTISYGDGSAQFSDTQKTVTVSNINGACSNDCFGGISAETTYRYDASGRLTSVTEPGGSDVTSYAYDANGKLAQVSQGVQTRTFAYDAAGFLRSETTPEKGAVTYDNYGSLGNVLSETEPGGLLVSRTYDFAGRLTGVVSGGLHYLTNCYDGQACEDGSPGYSGGLHPAGKLTRRIAFNPLSASTPNVTDDLAFSDPAGRLSSQTTTITGGSNLSTTQQWQFNGLGLIAHHSHPRPGGATPFVVSTDYDAGLPRTQYINGLPMVTGITHQASGALASYSTGIGIGHNVTTTISQDTSSLLPRPSRIFATPEGLPSPAFDTQSYTYDGAGNIVAMGPDSFGYDARSRLTSAALSGLGSQGFGYDRYGNLLSKGGVSFSVSASTNRITTASYDARGNLTGNGGESYDYDGLGRQIRHTAGQNVWDYAFDGADERLVKVPPSPGNWTYTLRDESKRILSEFVAATQSRDNVFLGNLLVASYANGAVGGNDRVWTFYSSDHLATPRLVTDITAVTLETPRNWPFGENAAPAGLFQRIRFAAMERDSEATRYYDHARNHEFNLGRFLSPDKARGKPEDSQSWNRYAYVQNNPLKFVDPDGQALKPSPIVSFDTAAAIRQTVRLSILAQPVGGNELSAATADFLLSSVLPQDDNELAANTQSSLIGIGTPIAGPGNLLERRGTTVLGHFPQYLQKAEELGARRFNIPTAVWNKMTSSDKWAANQKFLDRIIKRGDEVILSDRISKVKPGSTLEREIRYLLDKGYTLDKDGLRLRPPN